MPDYDIITVGGGLGGAALAKVMSEHAASVLVVERERQFKDRIRGEWLSPWGAAEMRRLGFYGFLLDTCANPQPYWNSLGFPLRDLRTATPHQLPALTFFHPDMQEIVLEQAKAAGAEVWRGAEVGAITTGDVPRATIQAEGVTRELSARLVVCADGRSSAGRGWLGFSAHRGKQRLLGAGVMFKHMRVAEDTSVTILNPALGRYALIFPQGHGRARAYLTWPKDQIPRLQGEQDFERFVAESVLSGFPAEYFQNAEPHGPLASFDMTKLGLNILIAQASHLSETPPAPQIQPGVRV